MEFFPIQSETRNVIQLLVLFCVSLNAFSNVEEKLNIDKTYSYDFDVDYSLRLKNQCSLKVIFKVNLK